MGLGISIAVFEKGECVKHVSVIGLGKLGSPMAASIAARGFRVTGVDLNPQKVDCLKRGIAPVKRQA